MKHRTSFREIDKKGWYLRLPPEVADAVRSRADAEGRSQALVATEAICRHLDLDPRRFGIEPIAAARR